MIDTMGSPLARNWRKALQEKLYRVTNQILGDSQGYVTLPVLSGPLRGARLKLRLTSNSEGNIFAGTYERQVVRTLSKVCKKGWTYWDCGTFLGYYTLLFAKFAGPEGKVVAVEPDPANAVRTRENIALNKVGHAQVVEVAIGGPVGELTFVATHNQSSHIAGTYVGDQSFKGAEKPNPESLVKVRCVSLDQLYQMPGIPRPQLVKLDLEGAEVDALAHCAGFIRECRPLLAVELHNPECDEAMWDFAQKMRYELKSLITGERLSARSDVGGFVLALPLS